MIIITVLYGVWQSHHPPIKRGLFIQDVPIGITKAFEILTDISLQSTDTKHIVRGVIRVSSSRPKLIVPLLEQ